MDLVKLLADKATEMTKNGNLEQIIDKHLTSAVDNVIRDLFSWNGEARNQIETVLKEKLVLPFDKIDLARYQLIVSDLVEKQLNNTVVDNASDRIKDIISKVTGVLDKTSYSLSDIIQEFKDSLDKSYDGEMEDQYQDISLHVKNDRGSFTWIYFDKNAGLDNYMCEYKIGLSSGKIFSVMVSGIPFSPFEVNSKGCFEGFLFQLYANNVSVELDTESIDLGYCREDVD